MMLNDAYMSSWPFPRLWHTACPGKDSDVIVFGGSCDYILLVDTVSMKKVYFKILHQQLNQIIISDEELGFLMEIKMIFFFRVIAMMHLFSRCSLILFSGKRLLLYFVNFKSANNLFFFPLRSFSQNADVSLFLTGFVKIILHGMWTTMRC